MQLKPLTLSMSVNVLLVLAIFSFVWGFEHTIANMPQHKERAELMRCQEGFTTACQQIIAMGEMK